MSNMRILQIWVEYMENFWSYRAHKIINVKCEKS